MKLVSTVVDSFENPPSPLFFVILYSGSFDLGRMHKSSPINQTLPTSTLAVYACMCTAPLGPTPITSLNPMGHIKSSLYILISLPTQPIPHLNTFLQNHPTRETEYYSIFQLWHPQLNSPPLLLHYVSSNS